MPPLFHRRHFLRLAAAVWLACAAAHAWADERRVLVLYSLGADSSSVWQRLVHKGLYDELGRSSQGATPAIFEERFDANRVGEDKAVEGMAPYLATKYADVKFDAIVTENFVASRFLASHPELFPGVPRHYVNHGRDQWQPRDGVGYELTSDFRQALGVIPLVAPQVRHVVVIGDTTARGRLWLDRVRSATQHFPAIRFEIWDDGSIGELRARAAKLDRGSAIFMLASLRGDGAARIQPRELALQVAGATRVPIFTHSESLVMPGVAGGYVVSGEAVGRLMARLLLGQPAMASQVQGYYFDYPTARRAGLRNIPPEAVMLNRPHNVWELYRWQIVAVAGLIVLQGMLITALVLALRSRRRTMDELASERNSLEDRILQRTLELLQANRKLEELATTDPLTGIANRRKMTEQIAQELERARRFHHPLSLLMVDIDHFKRINDTYGHEVGDQAIIHTATLLTAHLRAVDAVARFGGEEFVLLMPETPIAVAAHAAERLRAKASELRVRAEDGTEVELTISIGVSSADPHGAPDTPSSLLVRADKALYRAKKHARNRVIKPAPLECPLGGMKQKCNFLWKMSTFLPDPEVDIPGFVGLLEIRLRGRMCGLECGQIGAVGGDAGHVRVRRQVNLKTLGVEHLRYQATVGEGRRVTVAEAAHVAVALQVRFQRGQAFAHPMAVPLHLLLFGQAHRAFQVLQHAQVGDRVRVAGNGLRQRAHAGAAHRILRQQRHQRVHFLQVLDDGQRLRQHDAVVFQRRHQAGRVDRAVGRRQLLATVAQQVHRHGIVSQAFQVQRNADAVGGRTAEVGVELHARSS